MQFDQLRRRDFITLIGGTAAWPLAAVAQQTGKRIGFIEAGSRAANQIFLDSFRDGLAALGWATGQNLEIMDRWVEARNERLPQILDELLTSKVDVLVTAAAPASLAAKQATQTIPIVAVGIPDPVGIDLVASLARPGGNVTGFSSLSVELTAKRVELLREMLPKASLIDILFNPKDQGAQLAVADANTAVARFGLISRAIEAVSPDDIERAFTRMRAESPHALFIINDPLTVSYRDRIMRLALDQRLAVITGFRAFVASGALASLGTSLPNDFKRAARLVDKILRGASPSELPVEQPTEFELAINLRTAKELGIQVPPQLLARADEVIE
jgi:putative tryptophan/tyrosine transport system substrate-binding protein